jgi:hypothetical protein
MIIYRDITFTLELNKISKEQYDSIISTISKMDGFTGDLDTLTYDEEFNEAYEEFNEVSEAPF